MRNEIAVFVASYTLLAFYCLAGCSTSPSETNGGGKGTRNPESLVVSLIQPQDGAIVSDTVIIVATVSDSAAVKQVDFFINNLKETNGTVLLPPYFYRWNTRTFGDSSFCSIFASATTTSGKSYCSDTIQVMVYNGAYPPTDTVPPSVSIVYPQEGDTVSGSITIAASATDNESVHFVEFFIDGAIPQGAIEYNPPYEHVWATTGLPDESEHTIAARAMDASGNAAYSDTVHVVVNNSGGGSAGVVLNEDFTGRQIFPPDNWWNLDITDAPVDDKSASLINWIGADTPLHPDFGRPPYGLPYIGVPGSLPLRLVTFTSYGDESDPGAPGRPPGYPIPDEAYLLPNYIEGGVVGGGSQGDRHCIVIDRDHWFLFETYGTHWNPSAHRWEAASGAVFNLGTNDRRPEGWTSSDAAGLAVFPGLVKYEEVYGPGEITHAFRFTTRATNGHVWPASHSAGSNPSAPPLGARLRLKASVDISGYPPGVEKIFQAMKTYGLILADNGSDMYIQGTMDSRWNNDILNPAFRGIRAGDFEVIQLGWNPVVSTVPK